jgi:Pyruvate/2-oxoacid:ferredoxin oxidoreductase gamma subunit
MMLFTKVAQSLLGFVVGMVAVAALSQLGGCSNERDKVEAAPSASRCGGRCGSVGAMP